MTTSTMFCWRNLSLTIYCARGKFRCFRMRHQYWDATLQKILRLHPKQMTAAFFKSECFQTNKSIMGENCINWQLHR
jgi:hypothetical protein